MGHLRTWAASVDRGWAQSRSEWGMSQLHNTRIGHRTLRLNMLERGREASHVKRHAVKFTQFK